jgi:hypothetical protein
MISIKGFFRGRTAPIWGFVVAIFIFFSFAGVLPVAGQHHQYPGPDSRPSG